LQIKNSTIITESPFPLQSGEPLTVRIDQIKPAIVLPAVATEDPEITRINEFLKFYRSDPGAMKEMIASLKEWFSSDNFKGLDNPGLKKEMQALLGILNKIIISKENISNPLFLRDAILALGLTAERRLMKALSDPALQKDEKISRPLKEMLLKISSDLLQIQSLSDKPLLDARKIQQFNTLADQAAKVIEALQIVNIMAQEQDGLFLLQIPFQFAEGIRMQEIFIKPDKKGNSPGKEKQSRIVLFLDMDAVGEVAVDASLSDSSIRCTLKCSDKEISDFFQPLLPALRDSLSGINLTVNSLQCVLDRNIGSMKEDFLHTISLFRQSTIDVHI
jgi:hypothetical protein